MALSAVKNTVAAATAGGTQQIRGVGFRPKLVMLWLAKATANATWAADACFSFGAATEDGGTVQQMAFTFVDTDALGTSDTAIGQSSTNVLLGFTTATTPTQDYAATLAFNADGFDLVWSDAPAGAYVIHYLCLGGADITAARCGSVASVIAATQNVTVATGWGQPDLVIFPETTFTGNASYGKMVLGFAQSDTARACVGYMAQDAAATMTIGSYMAAKGGFAFTSTTVSAEAEWDLSARTNYPVDGFQVTYSDQWAAATRTLFYIAIQGSFQTAVGVTNSPVAAGNQDIAAGFTPVAALVFSDDLPAHAAIDSTHTDLGGFGLGVYDGTRQGMIDFQQDDANTTSVAKNMSDNASIIRLTGPGSTPTNLGIGTASFVTTNLRIAWTGVGTTARQFGYVILGSAPATGPITVQVVTPGSFTAGAVSTVSEQVPTSVGQTNFSAPQNSLTENVNFTAASGTFAGLATVSEQLNSVPASVTYSLGVVGAAVTPKIASAGLSTFNSGTQSLQSAATTTPGSVTYNTGNIRGTIVANSPVSSTLFSNPVSSISFNVNSNAGLTTFSAGTQKLVENVNTIAANVRYDAIATVPGVGSSITAVPASFTANTGAITVARVTQTSPGQITFSGLATASEVLHGTPGSISYTGGSNNSIGNAITTVPATSTYSAQPPKLVNSFTALATTTFDAIATVVNYLSAPTATTTFSSQPTPVGFFVNSTPANVIFDIPNVSSFYKLNDIPGQAFVSVLTNSIRVGELRNGIEVTVTKNLSRVDVEHDQTITIVEKNKEFLTNG